MFQVWSKWDWFGKKTREPQEVWLALEVGGVGRWPELVLRIAWMVCERENMCVCVIETGGICWVAPWQACVIIPKEMMESFLGELAVILIPCLLGWCWSYMEHCNTWLVSMASKSWSCSLQYGHILSVPGPGEKPRWCRSNWDSLRDPILVLWYLRFFFCF